MVHFDIPKEQQAQVLEEFGKPIILKTIPVPTPGPDDILINIKYSGVCHSDVHAWKGDWPVAPQNLPLVGGHEGVGVVVAKGANVRNFDLGDLAGVKWIAGTCGLCSFCQDGREPLCPDQRLGGYTQDGSFQSYAIVNANAGNKLPKDCDLAGLAPVMCAGLTVYKGLKESGARPGQYVAIVGAGGGLGSFGVQYAKAMGMIPIAVDGGAEKGKSCLELGAEHYVDISTSEDVFEDLKKATADGLGPHAAIIVSSEQAPFSSAAKYVRPGGTSVVAGIPTNGKIEAGVFDVCVRLVTIKGTLVGTRSDTDEAVEFYRRGLIKIPYRKIALKDVPEVMKQLDHNEVIGRYVVDMSA